MIDPNNASGAADALTPEGLDEYTAEMSHHDHVIAGMALDDTDEDDIDDHSDCECAGADPFGLLDEPDEPSASTDPASTFDVETHGVQPGKFEPIAYTAAVAPQPVVTGEFINEVLRNVRAPFDAKKKRGRAFKGARARLDKRADQAVREFRAAHLPELSEEQALRISLGITGLAGDSVRGFSYVDTSTDDEG